MAVISRKKRTNFVDTTPFLHWLSSSSSPKQRRRRRRRQWDVLVVVVVVAFSSAIGNKANVVVGQSSSSIISINVNNSTSSSTSSTTSLSINIINNPSATQLPPPPTTTTTTTSPPPPLLPAENLNPNITLGVYYYPWTRHKFVVQNPPEGYLRYYLWPQPQMPVLGNYDDTNPATIQQHIRWCKTAGISVWFTSWWGPNSRTDSTLLNHILPQLLLQPPRQANNHNNNNNNIRIAILYETKQWFQNLQPSDLDNPDRSFGQLQNDFEYLCQNYFHHPAYYKINDGRPVVYVYLTRVLQNRCGLQTAIQYIRRGCPSANLYIIGDQIWRDAPEDNDDTNGLEALDGIANYDIYGNLGKPLYAGPDLVKQYGIWMNHWKTYGAARNISLIPGVTPGYNDRGHRLQHQQRPMEEVNPPMSRRLTPTHEEGSLFEALLEESMPLVDPNADNLLLINSWNEWHEDTQIEPTVTNAGFTREPTLLTMDIEYRAYGTTYLEILRNYMSTMSTTTTSKRRRRKDEKDQEDNKGEEDPSLSSSSSSKKVNKYWIPSSSFSSSASTTTTTTTRQEEEDEEKDDEWEPDWC